MKYGTHVRLTFVANDTKIYLIFQKHFLLLIWKEINITVAYNVLNRNNILFQLTLSKKIKQCFVMFVMLCNAVINTHSWFKNVDTLSTICDTTSIRKIDITSNNFILLINSFFDASEFMSIIMQFKKFETVSFIFSGIFLLFYEYHLDRVILLYIFIVLSANSSKVLILFLMHIYWLFVPLYPILFSIV